MTAPTQQQLNDSPIAYMCPAGCGCLWRDNGDETMSLYGPRSQSCDVCEMEPLKNMVSLKISVTSTKPQAPEFRGTTWHDKGRTDTKPSWESHEWPQIFNDGDGHWFGVKGDWSMEGRISTQWKGRQVSLLSDDGEFLCFGHHPDWENSLEKRPAAWDGEQFPIPIGAKCECTFAVEHHDTWHKGKVVFHGVDPEGREYIVIDTGAYQACFRSLNHIRPIRTKEQRERGKAIAAALAMDRYPHGEGSGGLMSRAEFCGRLYDVGLLRKVD